MDGDIKMITEDVLETYLNDRKKLEKARDLYYSGGVGTIYTMIKDRQYDLIGANVIDAGRYHAGALIDKAQETVEQVKCSCQEYSETGKMCPHTAALIMKYTYESPVLIDHGYPQAIGETLDSFSIEHATSDSVMAMMELYRAPVRRSRKDTADLIPVLSDIREHTCDVKFLLRSGHSEKIIPSISDLIECIAANRPYYAGRTGSVIITEESFKGTSAQILDFLISIGEMMNSAVTANGVTPYIGSSIQLKNSLTDRLFGIIQDDPQYLLIGSPPEHIGRVSTGPVNADIVMKEENGGYSIACSPLFCLKGLRHLYVFVRNGSSWDLYISGQDTGSLMPFIDFLSKASYTKQYINEKDMKAFTRTVWPNVREQFAITADGFNEADYMPPKPAYTLYLDAPDPSVITCDAYVSYGDQRFSLFTEDDPDDIRDLYHESSFITVLRDIFTETDMERQLICINNEEKIYEFLRDRIHQLSEYAEVMISDNLKKIQLKNTGQVHVGISVQDNLLRLDLVSDTLSNEQIAEILSRYSRKQKYYRLRSGDFVEINDGFSELYDTVEELQISQSELRKGHSEMPLYRAVYLNGLSQSASVSFDPDSVFEDLSRRIMTVEQNEYEVPAYLTPIIRDYQKKGFSWLCSLRDLGMGGLLADEMGLGKTLQVIAVLSAWKNRKRTLIVCPSSLVYNWAKEIRKFAPELPYQIINGPASIRQELIRRTDKQDILITSYSLLQKDIVVYNDIDFDCMIIDEAQYIKNPGTLSAKSVKAVNAKFRIALTGTPIENRLSELWSIFDYLMPGLLHSYQLFRHTYEEPIILLNDEEAFQRLQQITSPFILRRMKRDVLQDLPPKLEEVIYAPLEAEQAQLYQAAVQNLKNELTTKTDKEFRESRIEVLAELTRLRQICCTPALLYSTYRGNSAKEETFMELLKAAITGGHKVLVFSQFTSMLDILITRMRKEKIQYHLLTGSTPSAERIAMVDSFQTDDIPVFFISLKAGGTGLNLTAADIVIHYDPWWNTAVENQASDRAHRIGQKNVVTVYRVILQDTIEERIIELQNTKKELAEKVLSDERMSSASLSRQELLDLL